MSFVHRAGAFALLAALAASVAAAQRPAYSAAVRDASSTAMADIRRVALVFRPGMGTDPGQLIDAVRGGAGLW